MSAFLAACSAESSDGAKATSPGDAPPAVAESPCADGFAVDADGACVETAAPATCPGGTRPRVGAASCEPVGWTSACPAGTSRDASGFGCSDPAPPAACTGATREAYGEASCVPVGDCSAAFPPAGAIVVDASLAEGQIDATHVRTIAEGVAAAGSGATVAVAAGVYEESVTLAKPVTLVGRCAANVELRSPAEGTKPGIDVRATGVTVRGLTLTGHLEGIAVQAAGAATIEGVVVRDARFAGLYVERGRAAVRASKVENTHPRADRRGGFDLAVGLNGDATVDDTTLTGGVQGVLGGGGKLAMTRVVITRQAPDPASDARPVGIAALGGMNVTVSRSVIRDLVGDGAASAEDDATIELDETIVRGVRIDGSAARGYGVLATYGGHVIARSSSISAIEGVAVLARDEDSSLSLTDSVVIGPGVTALPPAVPPTGKLLSDGRGAGVSIKNKARATLEGVAVVGAWGFGVTADSASKMAVERSLVDAPRGLLGAAAARSIGYGLVVNAATATVSDVSVTRCSGAGVSVGKGGKLTGDRLFVRDVIEGVVISAGAGLAVGAGGTVDLDASVIDKATATGVLITQGGDSHVRLLRSLVRGTRQTPEGFGHGVAVAIGARVVLEGTSVIDNPGIGVVADGGRALVDGTTVARNAVGIHAQSGSFLVELDDTDAESLAEGEVRVIPSTRFASNATRVGSGVVPLPSPILP